MIVSTRSKVSRVRPPILITALFRGGAADLTEWDSRDTMHVAVFHCWLSSPCHGQGPSPSRRLTFFGFCTIRWFLLTGKIVVVRVTWPGAQGLHGTFIIAVTDWFRWFVCVWLWHMGQTVVQSRTRKLFDIFFSGRLKCFFTMESGRSSQGFWISRRPFTPSTSRQSVETQGSI
jgi:hypothetical protein